jgi:hypothetical protein
LAAASACGFGMFWKSQDWDKQQPGV